MIGGKFARLKWRKPRKKRLGIERRALLAASAVGSALREEALEVGFPLAEKPKKDARAQAAELLMAAAEVEHALLAEYLYAAYSIDPSGPAAALQSIVVEIAKEEMGHLITVQNLLLAIGEEPYFDRESVTLMGKPAGDYPFPIAFEPMSGDTLAKYVTTESMPLKYITDPVLKDQLQPIFGRAAQAARSYVNHVGLLYAKIFWCFQADDSPNPLWPSLPGPEDLPPGWHITDKQLEKLEDQSKGFKDERQVNANEFGLTPVTPSAPNADPIYVIEIKSRGDALFALAQIAQQGEGFQARADSHFGRFFDAYGRFKDKFPQGALPVPTNPNTGSKPLSGPAEDGRITHPKAVRWAELFDVRYQLLLFELWLGVFTDRKVSGTLARANLFSAALNEMTDRVGPIASVVLPSLDRKQPAVHGWKAGAPFRMPDKALPRSETAVKRKMSTLLNDAESLAVKLEGLKAPDGPSQDELDLLKAMRDADKPFKDVLGKA